jgi:hypothetical protein
MSEKKKRINQALMALLEAAKNVPVNPCAPNRSPWEDRLLAAIYNAELRLGEQT